MKLKLKSKITIATLTLTPTPEGSEPDDLVIAKVKELIVKTFEKHIKVDLPDLSYEVEVVPGDKYKFIISACFTFESPVVDKINKILEDFNL